MFILRLDKPKPYYYYLVLYFRRSSCRLRFSTPFPSFYCRGHTASAFTLRFRLTHFNALLKYFDTDLRNTRTQEKMDRKFKKKAYTTSVLVSLVFFSIVVATYIDNYTCPMIWSLIVQNHAKTETLRSLQHDAVIRNEIAKCEQLLASSSDPSTNHTQSQHSTTAALNCTEKVLKEIDAVELEQRDKHQQQRQHPLGALVPNSIFHPNFHYIPCNVMDLLVHCYSVWFLLFMTHKWIMYKRAGWHYFMLDYCYFHNVLFIFFIFYVLVKVDVVGVVESADVGSVGSTGFSASSPPPSHSTASPLDLKKVRMPSSAVLRNEDSKKKPTTSSTSSSSSSVAGGASTSTSVVADTAEEEEVRQLGVILHMGFSGVLWDMVKDLTGHVASGRLVRRYLIDTGRNGLRLACKVAQQAVNGWGAGLDLMSKCEALSTSVDVAVTPVLGPASVTEIYLQDGTFVVSDSHAANKHHRTGDGAGATTYLEEMALLNALQPRIVSTEVFVRVQPLREAVADLTLDQKSRMVVLFIMFLSGSFGPILGAIVIWKNALLFHSVDKMTACFLHLAPGLVTLMMLNSIHSSSQVHLFASGGGSNSIDALYAATPSILPAAQASLSRSPIDSLSVESLLPSFVFAHPLFIAIKSSYDERFEELNALASSAKRVIYDAQHSDVAFLKSLHEEESEGNPPPDSHKDNKVKKAEESTAAAMEGVATSVETQSRRASASKGALKTSSTFLAIFAQFLTLKDFIFSHFVFFCLWQVFYHTTFELLAARRKIVFRVKKRRIESKIKTLTKEVKKASGGEDLLQQGAAAAAAATGSHHVAEEDDEDEFEEIELDEDEAADLENTQREQQQEQRKVTPKRERPTTSSTGSPSTTPPPSPGLGPLPSTSTSKLLKKYALLQRKEQELRHLGDSGTNPTNRVTAYTYMMEKPPMGKKGPLYRCATIFGEGPFVSKVMFNVMQWGFHCVFLFIGYVPMYLSLMVFQNVFILASYFFLFLIFSIWNAAGVMDHWIDKLQAKAGVADHEEDDD